MPSVSAWISRSHAAPLPNPLITIRTTHVPPETVSTRHWVASEAAGAPGPGMVGVCTNCPNMLPEHAGRWKLAPGLGRRGRMTPRHDVSSSDK
jgi:hypothetical protein